MYIFPGQGIVTYSNRIYSTLFREQNHPKPAVLSRLSAWHFVMAAPVWMKGAGKGTPCRFGNRCTRPDCWCIHLPPKECRSKEFSQGVSPPAPLSCCDLGPGFTATAWAALFIEASSARSRYNTSTGTPKQSYMWFVWTFIMMKRCFVVLCCGDPGYCGCPTVQSFHFEYSAAWILPPLLA